MFFGAVAVNILNHSVLSAWDWLFFQSLSLTKQQGVCNTSYKTPLQCGLPRFLSHQPTQACYQRSQLVTHGPATLILVCQLITKINSAFATRSPFPSQTKYTFEGRQRIVLRDEAGKIQSLEMRLGRQRIVFRDEVGKKEDSPQR